jgi:hypothetical protein
MATLIRTPAIKAHTAIDMLHDAYSAVREPSAVGPA